MANRLRAQAAQLATAFRSGQRALLTPELPADTAPEVVLLAALLLHLEDRVAKNATKAEAKASWVRATAELWEWHDIESLHAALKDQRR